ncbi:PAS domain-containing protein [Massilia sp. BJB1822]|uniref:PAS domain-containing protein n=1 Tax=Massilia sp. BJB1822 TaxID=2744470 RepID=UPI0015938D04|nr:PAS domain-containing protein [Massilia sp. BJB1822]NVE00129.1 PAS domain-containing protein [Massilia sp. BJB1822]
MNAPLAPRPRARVLIVDDAPAHLCQLTHLLAEQNYTVLVANSGADAMQFMALNVPDIVLLHVQKPGIDGYELCRHIKASARLCAVPVIFVSAADSSWDRAKAFSSGAADYLAQPIAAPEVLTRLETQLTLNSLRRQLEQRGQERSTELHKATLALQESRLLLRTIIDSATAIIHVKDPVGRYLLVNNRFRQLFGTEDEDLRGLRDADIFPAETAQAQAASERQVLATGASLECEEVWFHDGAPHTYIAVKSPLRDANGNIYAVCTIATDITERVREEAILSELNAMLESRLSLRLPDYVADAH